jgi:predicted ATPase
MFAPCGATIDVAAFDAALARGDAASLEEAIALYRGPLLEGCTELWACEEREKRETAHLAALEELADRAMASGDAARAECSLRHAIAVDPLRETAHRALMASLVAQGKQAAALEVYRELRLLLHQELNSAPDPQTVALADQIRSAARPGASVHRPRSRDTATIAARNLPTPPTPLLGREREVAALCDCLRTGEARLLTLTGPPGAGKTRLALEVASRLENDFADGVFFLPLAPVREPELVASAIAQSLGVWETGDRPVQESLAAFLRSRELLLVLDNFEQILAAAPLVATLLAAAPGLKILVTSRAALRLSAEQEFLLSPLPVPDPQRLPPFAELAHSPAVALFVQRAGGVRPDFRMTGANAETIVAICQRLDGLPLAIELAAARVRLFSPEALLPRLEGRLTLLTDGMRDMPARHQTLREAIAWSYDLLSEKEQRLFLRLSVFVGGCTLEAIEDVCGAEGENTDLCRELAGLVEQSLVQREETADGEARFTLLETLREYAQERLAGSGETQTLRRRHACCFLALAETAEPQLRSAERITWQQRLEGEYRNLQAALAWSQQQPGGEQILLRLAGALADFWDWRGIWREGRIWLEQALARPEAKERTSERAKALFGLAYLSWGQGSGQAKESMLEEAVAIQREVGDRRGLARSLTELAWQGDLVTAHSRLEESMTLARETGDSWCLVTSLICLGNRALSRTALDEAEPRFREALAISREIGAGELISGSLNCLAHVARSRGDYRAARPLAVESLAMARRWGGKLDIAYALRGLACVVSHEGDLEGARALYEESLPILRELGDTLATANYLNELGALVRRQGDFSTARALYEERLAIVRELGDLKAITATQNDLAIVAQNLDEYEAARALQNSRFDEPWVSPPRSGSDAAAPPCRPPRRAGRR